MSSIDIRCPVCGALNKSLDLEESDGWMECENCKEVTHHMEYVKTRYVPRFQKDEIHVLVPLEKK